MESQQAESIEVSELIAMETLEDYVQTDAKDLIVEELDTDEVHQIAGDCKAEDVSAVEDIEITEASIRRVLNDLSAPAQISSIYIIPLENGRLYVGITKNIKVQLEMIPYKTVSGVEPILFPKKSKLDLAKYWCILAEKYGEENVITGDQNVHQYYKQAFESCQSSNKRASEERKFAFKRNIQKSGFFQKIKSVVQSCKNFVSNKWPSLGIVKS